MQFETRDEFHKLINKHNWFIGLEVGVGLGQNASYLLDNSNLAILYGVENWSVRSAKKGQNETTEQMKSYGNRFKLLEMNSVEASKLFDDGELDYVYIDGDHRYKGIKRDLDAWYPKVREGGFFGGHDYVVTKRCGVVQAVDEFFEKIGRTFNLTNEINDGRVNKSFWMIK